jgi:septal ring factor EnvC (AmiA/AmiB activator)
MKSHVDSNLRKVFIVSLAAIMALCAMLLTCTGSAEAQEEERTLQEEVDRLSYQILELRARRKLAEKSGSAIREELNALENDIANADTEIQRLEQDLSEYQETYHQLIRSLYKQGNIHELEVLLEEEEIDVLWQDIDYCRRVAGSESEVLMKLRGKREEIALRKRDLSESRQKRERLLETLDVSYIDDAIAELEAKLSQTAKRIRDIRGGRGSQKSPTETTDRAIPAPGQLLDRVPNMPPLSDFERSGISFSGYTTSYGAEFHGKPTASGVIFNMYDYTCAHRTLPFGTWLLVTLKGRQVIVQVNDRGPFVPGRVLDLSQRAAEAIGLSGVQWTEFEVLVPRGG